MIAVIDSLLDRITMYRLVLYYLIVLLVYAFLLSIFNLIIFTPFALVTLVSVFLFVSYVTNKVFAYIFEAPTNVESVYITALILSLIFTPPQSVHTIVPLAWVAVWAMASKYIFAIGKKHIFNPVAAAAVITSFGLDLSASWWVGSAWMMPAVVIGGLLIVRKIRRSDLVFTFFLTALMTIAFFIGSKGGDLLGIFQKLLFSSSLFFFAFIMLTEPLTTPPTKKLQMVYGGLVGMLFAPQMQLFGISSTPELALIVGNIFSYLVSPKHKLLLLLQEKTTISSNIIDFLFAQNKKISFKPGQYMEWTLAHQKTDSRGNRRYFTIASSPTETNLRLGVKFYEKGSTFKRALYSLNQKTPIIAAQLAGDFTLPDDPKQKITFIAGGVGITPYRSMIKYLIDLNQQRPIVLLYANKQISEIAYQDVFLQAQKELGIKTVYTLTDKALVPNNWTGRVGRIDEAMIRQEIPDYQDRLFYISGPQTMIDATKNILKKMGIKKRNIKTDYFPGLA